MEISKEYAKQIYEDEIRAKIEKLSNVCKKATSDDVLFAFAIIRFFA